MLVEGRYGNYRDPVLRGQVAREIGLALFRNRAVISQHEECAGTGQWLEARRGQAGGQTVALGLVERRQLGIRRRIAQVFSQRKLHGRRSEEHTSELKSLMRNSYTVFCLKKK